MLTKQTRRFLGVALLTATLIAAIGRPVAADSIYYHVVAPGETLASIAALYGVDQGALLDANRSVGSFPLGDQDQPTWDHPDLIYPGQRIAIPLGDEDVRDAAWERVTISVPAAGSVQTGQIQVSGWGRSPVNVMELSLYDASGAPLQEVETCVRAEIGQVGPFQVNLDVPSIAEAQPCFLSVRPQGLGQRDGAQSAVIKLQLAPGEVG